MVQTKALGYRLTELPDGHPEAGWFSIDVKWLGGEAWEVTRNGGDLILNRDGVWQVYPPRTQWTEQWRSQNRWPSLAEALAVAREALPSMVWNGRTAMDALLTGVR